MANYRTYARTCRTQVEVAMSQLELYLAPTYENILALLLAAAFAMERCKPSLCWVLVSNAAGLVRGTDFDGASFVLIPLSTSPSILVIIAFRP